MKIARTILIIYSLLLGPVACGTSTPQPVQEGGPAVEERLQTHLPRLQTTRDFRPSWTQGSTRECVGRLIFECIAEQGGRKSSPETRPYDLTVEQLRPLQVAAVPDMVIASLYSRADAFGTLAPFPSRIHVGVQTVLDDFEGDPLVLPAAVYRSILEALYSQSLFVQPGVVA